MNKLLTILILLCFGLNFEYTKKIPEQATTETESLIETCSKCGAIRGRFSSINGEAITTEIQIDLLTNNEKTPMKASIDSNGNYIFLDVPVGSYDVIFSSMGYKSLRTNQLSVTSNRTVWLNAVLEPKPKIKFVPFDTPPKPRKHIKPTYPKVAKDAGIEGTVYIQFFVDVKGNVTEAYVTKGLPNTGLDEAALTAVKESKWKPARQRLKKVGVWQTVPVRFQLN